MASWEKAPLPNSKLTISLENIMAPTVAGMTSKLIIEIASEIVLFNPLILSSADG